MKPGDATARSLVDHLGLEPHPEGGWYRRVWTAPDAIGSRRGSGSSIQYLLEGGQPAQWHRIDASEMWVASAGSPVEVCQWLEGAEVTDEVIGPDLEAGHAPQMVVEPGRWQSARSLGAWSLVVCVVVPEFLVEGFELAPPGWSPRLTGHDPTADT